MLLLSKAQCHIWQIAWDLWSQHNQHLHGDHSSKHGIDKQVINNEVTHEWNQDNLTLFAWHQHLFCGTLDNRLKKSYHSKCTWLALVWSVQEITDINYLENNPVQTNSTVRLGYEQWKWKRKTTLLNYKMIPRSLLGTHPSSHITNISISYLKDITTSQCVFPHTCLRFQLHAFITLHIYIFIYYSCRNPKGYQAIPGSLRLWLKKDQATLKSLVAQVSSSLKS